MVCCRRQPKIKLILLKIHVVVQVRIVPTESIQPSFMLREQGWGGLSITKTILRRTKEQFNLKYRNQSKEQTLVEVNIHHRNFTTDHRCKHILIHTLNIHRWNYYPISP
jgi:transcription initiation factor IIF auxiliary subunit